MAYNTSVYHWSLGGNVPEGFIVTPVDSWPGHTEAGRFLCEAPPVFDRTASDYHDFGFLRDLKTLGGDQARRIARQSVEDWIAAYPVWDSFSWNPDILGNRLMHWVVFYDFFGASADESFQDLFFASLARQARHLSRALPHGVESTELLEGIRGLVFVGVSLQGRQSWLTQAMDLLETEVERQILADGCHRSRSPAALTRILQSLLDIRTALLAGRYPIPAPLDQTIDRTARALRFFRYPDKGFALFHGTQEGDIAFVDALLTRSNVKGRVLSRLQHGGYERLTQGRSLLMVDAGAPPRTLFDKGVHAAPLAFEFIYGKERIFVNCGTHPFDSVWQDALRATAAHNTLTIDHRNACEIDGQGHLSRKARKVTLSREETPGAQLLEVSHDGYVPLNGVTHRRRFYLGNLGHDLRGEETLTCSVGLNRTVDIHLRFHLHPRVQISLIREGTEALLRLPGGAGWRFFHSGGDLSLENSIYLGQDSRPRKTKQLVVTGTMDSDRAQIKWALQREGI
ncbi:MAG: heparinase II/III family protein [Alphaproteobacteria bacterium]|nr:heparinase II/III family protein [Alphaproteobacteria bacterium]